MTDLQRDKPSSIFLGALAATAAPAALGALAAPIIAPRGGDAAMAAAVFLFALPIAALHVFILFVPVYLLLRLAGPVRWTTAAAAGLVLGALPAGLLLTPYLEGADLLWLGAAALHGLCGALAFSWTLKRLA